MSRADAALAVLGYCGNPLDRAPSLREDAVALARLETSPETLSVIFCGDQAAIKTGMPVSNAFFATHELARFGASQMKVFLGLRGKAPVFGRVLDAVSIEAPGAHDDIAWRDLRSLAVEGALPESELSVLAQAKALLNWHAAHRHCAQCGAPSQIVQGGWRRDCAACSAQHFPRTDPVVIMLVTSGEECLLGRQPRFAANRWSCLAGFMEPGETIEAAVRREVEEEAGIVCGAVCYVASQPWPFPSSLMIGCHADALSHAIRIDRNELEDARWFSRLEIAAMLTGSHGDGITLPPAMAIAHHLLHGWAAQAL